jgi:hypothetical protein
MQTMIRLSAAADPNAPRLVREAVDPAAGKAAGKTGDKRTAR